MVSGLSSRWNSLDSRKRAVVAGVMVAIGGGLILAGWWRFAAAQQVRQEVAQLETEVAAEKERLRAFREAVGDRGSGDRLPIGKALARTSQVIRSKANANGVRLSGFSLEGAGSASDTVNIERAAGKARDLPGVRAVEVSLNGRWETLAGLKRFLGQTQGLPAAWVDLTIRVNTVTGKVRIYGV